MKRFTSVSALVVMLAVAFFVGWVRLPYYSLGPGPAREVMPLIRVKGHASYASEGSLIMTTVRYYPVTALQALISWLDPDREVVRRDQLFPPGESEEQEEQRAISQMDQSKIDATYVVLEDLVGYPKDHGAGALIESVIAGCPAEGELFAGDLVLAIDGVTIGSQRQASRALDTIPAQRPVMFRVRAAGETHEVKLTRAKCGQGRPLVGITMVDAFPIDVEISSGDVGGPSAGLMWALGLYDLLTPGDLTDGRTIAGTGTIDTEGAVGPIGGIEDKVIAAQDAGADVFLVPRDDLAELRDTDTGDMALVAITSFDDALEYLRQGVAIDPP